MAYHGPGMGVNVTSMGIHGRVRSRPKNKRITLLFFGGKRRPKITRSLSFDWRCSWPSSPFGQGQLRNISTAQEKNPNRRRNRRRRDGLSQGGARLRARKSRGESPAAQNDADGRFARKIRKMENRDRKACKPGSVPQSEICMDGHSSGTPIARRLTRSTRAAGLRINPRAQARRLRADRPYSTLLPAGLAMPPTSPPGRWALTPPFHPCSSKLERSVLCGAFPKLAKPSGPLARRRLSGAASS